MASRSAARPREREKLLVDTMVIIDCHRHGLWSGVCKHFQVETVQECAKEALRGANLRQRVPITSESLEGGLGHAPHQVTDVMRAALATKAPNVSLDPGERDLIAYALTLSTPTYILCGPDKALVKAAVYSSIENTLISLEEILQRAGMRPPSLDDKNSSRWLSITRTQFLLEL